MVDTQGHHLEYPVVELAGVPWKEEDEEDKETQWRNSESLQHHKVVVRDAVIEAAIGFGVDEALEVEGVAIIDGALIGCHLDVVGEDHGEQEKEKEDEHEKAEVEEDEGGELLEGDEKDRDSDDRDDEENDSEKHRKTHRDEPKRENPSIVFFRCDKTTIGLFLAN